MNIPKRFRLLLLAPALLAFGGSQAIEPPATAPMVAISPAERIDALLAERFSSTTPGLVVGVVRGGELVYAGAAGMADLAQGVPLRVDTRMNIGSTAKQFTGLAIVLLAQQGKLDLDVDVRDYLPELPDLGAIVSLRHLLTHTSGYRELFNTLALGGLRIDESDWVPPAELFAVVQRQPALQNPPGLEWNYNNTGYGLLAVVASRATGQPWDELLAELVFRPLRMHATMVRPHPGSIVPGRSVGYRVLDGEFLEAGDLAGASGAGGVYTTLEDMARWMLQLRDWPLGGEAARDLVTTPFLPVPVGGSGYGFGLTIDSQGGQRRWQHGGGDVAHRSWFAYYPDLDAGWMVFSNHAEAGAELARELVASFFAEEIVLAEGEAAVDAVVPGDEPVEPYLGRFELEAVAGFVLRVFVEDGQLRTQATGQPALDLQRVGPRRYRIAGVDAHLLFDELEGEAAVMALTVQQNGEHRARRIEEDEQAVRAGWPALVGRYWSDELEAVYRIEIDEQGLLLRQRRMDPLRLTHVQGDRYSSTFPVATLEFLRDDAGTVTGLKVGNGRARDIRFVRWAD